MCGRREGPVYLAPRIPAKMFRCLQFVSVVLFCEIILTSTFNLDPRIPVIKRGDKGTYFGYSVAEHQVLEPLTGVVKEQVLLVGAPRASTRQPGTNRTGAVYRCRMSTYLDDCNQINIENEGRPPDDDTIKDDQWLGVTVKSQGPGGYVLTCAHRYIKKGPDFQWGLGICYSLNQLLGKDRVWEPCMNRPVSKAHEQFGYCQAGTSGDISEDNKLVIGSPGPYTWRGTVFVNSISFGIRDDKTWYLGPLLDDNAAVDKYSYLGMSVTSGKFFGSETSFIGGAPRANGTGQVVFFKKQKIDSTFLVQLVLSGEQFASSYGYSLASVDINSDGFLDLIVGCPFYYEKGKGGAIYIYSNSKEGISEDTEPLKIFGKHDSQFGLALSTVGDLNKDGYPDLAVGAPYEGNGAVYIFLGSPDGLIVEPSQVIKAEGLPEKVRRHGLHSFGYSVSGGMDLDNNSYPDLLVGAYDSDAIVLLRSRPIIDIITSVEGNLTNIDPNGKGCPEDRNVSLPCFSFEACFQFNSSVLSHGTYIQIKYRIEAETFTGNKYYRVKFRSPLDPEIPNIVEKKLKILGVKIFEPHCSRELVYLKEKTDIQTPIKLKLTYTLIQKEPKMVPVGDPLPNINEYPILNQQEASKVFEARFLKDCGSNDICESDLHVVAELNLPKDESGVPVLYLGEQQVNLFVVVYNMKEPAYDANLYVTHPHTLSYIGRKVVKGDQIECFPFNDTIVKCEIGNPMNSGEVEFQIRFNPRGLSDEEKKLEFILKANTTSVEVSPEVDLVVLANVVRVAELELRGVSDPEQIIYGENVVDEEYMKTGEDIGSLVIHRYELINYGPWNAKEVHILMSWPYQTETFTENGKWILYMMETPQVYGNGYCELKPGIINPLHLQIKREDDQFVTQSDTSESSLRRKRQAPEEIRLDSKTANIVTLDCDSGTAKCHHFRCIIRDLRRDQNAIISIRARLWHKTFVEDYARVDRVDVISRAHIYLDPSLDIKQRIENDYSYVLTKAFPDIPLYQKPEEVPLWIIILAVCGGLLLLILLIYCLWKLGFFKRKKPGYVPAATSEKEKEFNNI